MTSLPALPALPVLPSAAALTIAFGGLAAAPAVNAAVNSANADVKANVDANVNAADAASASSTPPATGPATNPADLIAALNGTFGKHPGMRASHAKGFCATGDFEPSRTARGLTRSALYRESRVAATLRFSIAGGNPKVSDKSRTVRGLSIHLQGEHERHDLVLISEPVFFAASLESFVEFLRARVADPTTGKPDPARIKAYEAKYPDGARQPALLASHPAPASYATTAYHSTHAFAFKTAAMTTWARIVAVPAAGTRHLAANEEAALPDLFLEAEAASRLARGPIDFTLFAQPAAPGDSLVDPSQPWSAQGPAPIELGRLRVRRLAEVETCDKSMFIPTVLPEGIEAGDDPILQARGAAYGVSMGQRLQR